MEWIIGVLYGFNLMLCQFPNEMIEFPNGLTGELYGENKVYRRPDQQFPLLYETKSGITFRDISEDGINGNEQLYNVGRGRHSFVHSGVRRGNLRSL